MCSKISTSLYNNSSKPLYQRHLIERSSGSTHNEFGDWRNGSDSDCDKPRVSSDSEMQTTSKYTRIHLNKHTLLAHPGKQQQ